MIQKPCASRLVATFGQRMVVRVFSSNSTRAMIRLSKRMSELDMCSRREADGYISRQQVLVRGAPAILGQKVLAQETDIEIMDTPGHAAVVLHKPVDYVSGQAEHGHVPAIKLLRASNLVDDYRGMDVAELGLRNSNDTLTGYAPAGRLDKDSSGLLVFCKSGVLAKKLISPKGLVEKEYVVEVEVARSVSSQERRVGMEYLRNPTLDLSLLRKGGRRLWNDPTPLRPANVAWLDKGKVLKFVLKEGRKRQIRRMCRELLGYHVLKLERTRIGPIKLDGLASGQWRPLRQDEIDSILEIK